MKITCAVEVSNRSYPAVHARHKQKYSVATLALCHKSRRKEFNTDKDAILILCTHNNPKGTKYKVYIYEHFFFLWWGEGKSYYVFFSNSFFF